uniref:uncharacterized protein LOC124042117 isoform X2 n=2 Tax=Oncorhynchus gorbuscha TaxID=8017 RepID=UPI001EAF3DEA|nr:uncharacterized protein LOC124042117 isoform X2 [Oncorhynchus gorbuscha]
MVGFCTDGAGRPLHSSSECVSLCHMDTLYDTSRATGGKRAEHRTLRYTATGQSWNIWAAGPSWPFVLWGHLLQVHILLDQSWGETQAFQRKLLMEYDNNPASTTTAHPTVAGSSTGSTYLIAALASAFTVSLFLVVAFKCRLFHRYLASNRHALLPEGDTASQYSPDEVSFPGHGMVGRGGEGNRTHRGLDTDDDDGFIEDNYIQASERARAESHVDDEMEGEDSDDDLLI